jgi:hypothetical protein
MGFGRTGTEVMHLQCTESEVVAAYIPTYCLIPPGMSVNGTNNKFDVLPSKLSKVA